MRINGAIATGALLATIVAPAAKADGTFLQADFSTETAVAVGSVTRDRLTFGSVLSSSGDEAQLAVSTGYTLYSADGTSLKIGPSAKIEHEAGEGFDNGEIGLKLVADHYRATGFGGLYGQVEYDTIDSAWFVLAQANISSAGLAIEVSRGGSDTYDDAALAVSKRIPDTRLSLRAGYRFLSEDVFLGVSLNTF